VIATYIELLTAPAPVEDGLNPAERIYFDEAGQA
jgi:hypothetical protein